ncbi:MAG TPA: GtrA family protein [Dehalococcoidia bacterium]|nr:GtrA family protein [Dehalococcoidia bacterium]
MSDAPLPPPATEAGTSSRGHAPRSLRTQFVLFALIGVGNAAVDAAVFTFLVAVLDWRHGIAPLAASVVGFCFGAAHSYVWNSRVTFRFGRSADNATVVGQFLSVAVGGAIVSAIAFSVVRALWPDAHTTLAASKLGAIAVGMVWNFSLLRGWVFSHRRRERLAAQRDFARRTPDPR